GRTDPEFEGKVHRVDEPTTAMLQKLFRHMIEAGHLTMPDDEIAPLADNIWMVIRYWPSFLRETRKVVKLDRMTLNAGIRHHFALFEAHLSAKARHYFDNNAYA